MTLNEYQTAALLLWKPNHHDCHLLGLVGEAGEVCDLVKKHLYHGVPFTADAMTKELGDCMWYAAAVAWDCDWTLDDLPLVLVDATTYQEAALGLAIRGAQFVCLLQGVPRKFTTISAQRRALAAYIECVITLARFSGVSLDDVLQTNIIKLLARYPSGFVPGGGMRHAEDGPDIGADVPGGGATE